MIEPILSVIVPVYNVEKYLEKCLSSLVNQTLKNIQIILVNDGSTDNSLGICEKYSNIDNRIQIINKKNGGLSDARNVGVSNAKGKYISFIDSDDFIENNSFEILVNELEINELDIISAYPISIFENGKILHDARRRSNENQIKTGIEYLVQCVEEGTMLWPVQFNVYSAELVKNIKFKYGILHEDMLWTPQVFLKARRVKCIPFDFYYYLKRNNSITHMQDKRKNGIDMIKSCYELEEVFNRIKNKTYKKIMMDYLVGMYLNGFYIGRLWKKEDKQLVTKKFVLGKSFRRRNVIKSILFVVNKKLYIWINDIDKAREKV